MAAAPNLTLQLRPALRLLHAARGRRQPDRQVQHRHRQIDPQHDSAPRSKKDNFQPRVSLTSAPRRTVIRVRLRHLRRARSDRRSDSADRERTRQHDDEHRPAPRVPARPGPVVANFATTRTTATTSRGRTPTNTRFPRRSTSTRFGSAGSGRQHSPRRRPTWAARDATCSSAASRTRSRRSSPTQPGERGDRHP